MKRASVVVLLFFASSLCIAADNPYWFGSDDSVQEQSGSSEGKEPVDVEEEDQRQTQEQADVKEENADSREEGQKKISVRYGDQEWQLDEEVEEKIEQIIEQIEAEKAKTYNRGYDDGRGGYGALSSDEEYLQGYRDGQNLRPRKR